MTQLEHRLSVAGVTLFLYGLILGFGVPAFPDKHMVLGTHETALGSGTFLIAVGMLWPKLVLSTKWANLLAHLLWISFYVLTAGLTLGSAVAGTSPDAPLTPVQMVGGILVAGSAVLMAVVVLAVLIVLIKSKPKTV